MASEKKLTATFSFNAEDNLSAPVERMEKSCLSATGAAKELKSAISENMSAAGLSSTAETAERVSSSLSSTSSQMNFWTSAVGNYDKSLLEATNTTEELVAAGYKTEEALEAEKEMLELCAKSQNSLNMSMSATTDIQKQLSSAMSAASKTTAELTEYEDISAETKENLSSASSAAAEAMENLKSAQEEAKAAMENYNEVMASGTNDLATLEAAAEQAGHAAENLAEANGRASEACENLTSATEEANSEIEKAKNESEGLGDVLDKVTNTIVFTKIVDGLKDVASGLVECNELSAEFGVNLAKLSTVADTENTSMSTLRDELKALSSDIGEDVNSLTEATYQAISASVDTAEAVEFTGTATKLAIGGFTESATAVDVLTTAINAYGKSASDAENISDMLITTQNLGKTSVDQLAQSVGKVIPIAAAYNVEMDNLMSAYAELTKGGIATAEAGTYLKSMLNELGDSGSEVSSVLQEQTGKTFAQLSEEGYSLGDVLDVLGDSVGNNATKFNELWSSSEAGVGALSLLNAGSQEYNETLSAMQNSAGAAEEAFEAMDNTVADAKEDMINAANNLKIAIGDSVSPAFDKLYSAGGKVLTLAADFANDFPVVTQVLTAAAIGVGVVTAGVAAFTFTMTVAVPAVQAFASAVTKAATEIGIATGPIGWITLGISALVVAVSSFIAMQDKSTSATKGLTTVSKQQYKELEKLNEEYEASKAALGDNATETLRLRNEVNDLTYAYEQNRMTIDELVDSASEAVEKSQELRESYSDSASEISNYETATLSLVQRLEDLSAASDGSAENAAKITEVVDRINERVPSVGAVFGNATENIEAYTAAVRLAAEESAREQKIELNDTTIADYEDQAAVLDAKRVALEQELAASQAVYDEYNRRANASNGYDRGEHSQLSAAEWEEYNDAAESIEKVSGALENVKAEINENTEATEQLRIETEALQAARQRSIDAVSDAESAVNTFLGLEADAISELKNAYQEAYDEAYESISSQIGLFDTMKTEVTMTTDEMMAALDSQIAYMNNYSENLKLAMEYGFDSTVIEKLSDGSQESAGQLQALIDKVDSLGSSTEAASDFVNNFNSKFDEVETAKEGFSDACAQIDSDFQDAADSIVSKAETMVDGMNLSDEAKAAATETVNTYINTIKSGLDGFDIHAYMTSKGYTGTSSGDSNVPLSVQMTTGYSATGGIYDRPYLTWVAEAGDPEAIIPLNDTQRAYDLWAEAGQRLGEIRGTSGNDTSGIDIPKPVEMSNKETSIFEKTIVIKVEGSGEIKIPKTLSKDEVLGLLQDNAKSVFMNIIEQEMFEEGDEVFDT